MFGNATRDHTIQLVELDENATRDRTIQLVELDQAKMATMQRLIGGMLMPLPIKVVDARTARLREFHDALALAEKEVASWPEWKRAACEAGLDGRSANKTARKPILADDCY